MLEVDIHILYSLVEGLGPLLFVIEAVKFQHF